MHHFASRLSSVKFHRQIEEKLLVKLFCAVILITMETTPVDARVAYLPSKPPQNTQSGYIPINQGGMFQNPTLRVPEYLPGYSQDTSQYGETQQIGLTNHHLRPFSTPPKPEMVSEPYLSSDREVLVSDDPNSFSPTWGSSETLDVKFYNSQAPFFGNSKTVVLPRQPLFNFFSYYQQDRRKYAFVYNILDTNDDGFIGIDEWMLMSKLLGIF